uniref:LAGLIDADG/HNH endonuclease n=1 Tax=Parasitella parasitica TaxID=35722 RepID=A0A088SQK5_9FUNG|nr:LAGLIDADG/HNH endonuclease [Parasitella parasitica]AIO05765.1 LAGLIDADG/HNH endonuclease [Parasitella parasitica]
MIIMYTNKLYDSKILNPHWVLGFVDGEGCFHVSVSKNNNTSLGYQVTLEFTISQHIRDKELMMKLIKFFGCGYVTQTTSNHLQFRIRNRNDLRTKLYPFFDIYPPLTIKSLDYLDFKLVHSMLDDKLHLTQEGLDKIRTIQTRMNRNRN